MNTQSSPIVQRRIWINYRDELNRAPLAHEEWDY
jgi:hypothetical protein